MGLSEDSLDGAHRNVKDWRTSHLEDALDNLRDAYAHSYKRSVSNKIQTLINKTTKLLLEEYKEARKL